MKLPHKVVHMLHFLHFDLFSVNSVLTVNQRTVYLYCYKTLKNNNLRKQMTLVHTDLVTLNN